MQELLMSFPNKELTEKHENMPNLTFLSLKNDSLSLMPLDTGTMSPI